MAGLFRELVVKRITRSSKWPKFRSENISDTCACCGKSVRFLRKFRMCLHHITPFHIRPDLELNPANVLTLCNNPRCHLDRGHLGDWRSWNWNVTKDCELWLWKFQTRPYKKKRRK